MKDSVVLRHVLLVLESLTEGDGKELTATRNLNRRFVSEMLDAFDWPGYEAETIRAVIKLGPGKCFEFNYDICNGCGLCVAECPCGAIQMVPETI